MQVISEQFVHVQDWRAEQRHAGYAFRLWTSSHYAKLHQVSTENHFKFKKVVIWTKTHTHSFIRTNWFATPTKISLVQLSFTWIIFFPIHACSVASILYFKDVHIWLQVWKMKPMEKIKFFLKATTGCKKNPDYTEVYEKIALLFQ